MSRQTYTNLQTSTKDMVSLTSGSVASSTVANYIKEYLNKRYHFIHAKLRRYISQDIPGTASTVEDQQFYHYPPNIQPPIHSATLTISDIAYPLTIVESQERWDRLNEVSSSGTSIPQFIFPRRDDFGIYPTPAEDDNTITLAGTLLDRDMTIEDYTTGTVTVTNNSTTVTGAGTTFTAAMVGRWFQTTNDQFWYRIAAFTSTTVITLETSFQGTTGAAQAYTIGETPEIPAELHELLPHGAAADFYSGPRKDFNSAQAHLNYFWTGDYSNTSRVISRAGGGLLDALDRYSRRGESSIVESGSDHNYREDEIWSTTLTDS